MYRLDFKYLKDLPILVLDVNEDFKNDRIKQEGITDKVRILYMDLWTNSIIKNSASHSKVF